MSKYALKQRVEKVVQLIDHAAKDLEGKKLEDIGSFSILARASCFTVEQVCEHLIALEEDLKEKTNSIPWKQVHAIRVRIAHMYDSIEMDVIYETIKKDFPALKNTILEIVKML